MHTTQQGRHAQTTPIQGTQTDPLSLHMGAANSLHRALHELLIEASDYGRAVQHAESAIAAMAALSLMNGRA